MTRLADVTRLDRVGLPVWQAIRPMSRALSVHQGKGRSRAEAQIGAMLEAVESDAAERFDLEGPVAAWEALPVAQRPACLADFAADRSVPSGPSDINRWAIAERVDGRSMLVPFDCVSLDFTRAKESALERSSAGLAVGTSSDDAKRAALLELVERDSVSRFDRLNFIERLQCEIDASSISFDWFHELVERMGHLELRLFGPESPTDIPVVIAAVGDDLRAARPYAATVGHAAHGTPEIALFKAVAEALQSRLTLIAGSREDCWPSLYTSRAGGIAASLAPPPVVGIDAVDFESVTACSDDWQGIARGLASMSVEETAFIEIARPGPFVVFKAFAPGLGSLAKEPRL